MKKKINFVWIVLIGIILIRGFAGGINSSSGLFLSPVSQDLGVGIGQLSLYLSIASIVTLLWLPIAGRLVNSYDVRLVAIVGIILQAGSFIGFGFMNSIWGWYVLAIPNAMGSTILVNILGPVLINRWFSKNVGMIIGILMAFVGVFGAVIQPLATRLIANSGWRNAYIFIGLAIMLVVVLAAVFFIRNRPEDKNTKPYGYREVSNTNNKSNIGVKASVAKKSSAFYLLVIFMIALTGFALFTQHITTNGLELGYSMDSLGMALSLSMVGSAIGAILIGTLSDKIGAVKTSISVVVIGVISILLFLTAGKSFIIFKIATFLHGLALASLGVLAPILTSTFFGGKDYEKLLANVMMGSPIASIILIPAYGYIYDIFGGYKLVFMFLLVLMVIAVVSISLGFKHSRQLLANTEDQEILMKKAI